MSDKKLDISNTHPQPTSSTLSSLSSSPLVSSTFEQENKGDSATNKALLQRIHSLEATLEGKAEDLHAVQFAVESDSSCFYNSRNITKESF